MEEHSKFQNELAQLLGSDITTLKRIHFDESTSSDSESGGRPLDEDYMRNQPPPCDYNIIKDSVVKISTDSIRSTKKKKKKKKTQNNVQSSGEPKRPTTFELFSDCNIPLRRDGNLLCFDSLSNKLDTDTHYRSVIDIEKLSSLHSNNCDRHAIGDIDVPPKNNADNIEFDSGAEVDSSWKYVISRKLKKDLKKLVIDEQDFVIDNHNYRSVIDIEKLSSLHSNNCDRHAIGDIDVPPKNNADNIEFDSGAEVDSSWKYVISRKLKKDLKKLVIDEQDFVIDNHNIHHDYTPKSASLQSKQADINFFHIDSDSSIHDLELTGGNNLDDNFVLSMQSVANFEKQLNLDPNGKNTESKKNRNALTVDGNSNSVQYNFMIPEVKTESKKFVGKACKSDNEKTLSNANESVRTDLTVNTSTLPDVENIVEPFIENSDCFKTTLQEGGPESNMPQTIFKCFQNDFPALGGARFTKNKLIYKQKKDKSGEYSLNEFKLGKIKVLDSECSDAVPNLDTFLATKYINMNIPTNEGKTETDAKSQKRKDYFTESTNVALNMFENSEYLFSNQDVRRKNNTSKSTLPQLNEKSLAGHPVPKQTFGESTETCSLESHEDTQMPQQKTLATTTKRKRYKTKSKMGLPSINECDIQHNYIFSDLDFPPLGQSRLVLKNSHTEVGAKSCVVKNSKCSTETVDYFQEYIQYQTTTDTSKSFISNESDRSFTLPEQTIFGDNITFNKIKQKNQKILKSETTERKIHTGGTSMAPFVENLGMTQQEVRELEDSITRFYQSNIPLEFSEMINGSLKLFREDYAESLTKFMNSEVFRSFKDQSQHNLLTTTSDGKKEIFNRPLGDNVPKIFDSSTKTEDKLVSNSNKNILSMRSTVCKQPNNKNIPTKKTHDLSEQETRSDCAQDMLIRAISKPICDVIYTDDDYSNIVSNLQDQSMARKLETLSNILRSHTKMIISQRDISHVNIMIPENIFQRIQNDDMYQNTMLEFLAAGDASQQTYIFLYKEDFKKGVTCGDVLTKSFYFSQALENIQSEKRKAVTNVAGYALNIDTDELPCSSHCVAVTPTYLNNKMQKYESDSKKEHTPEDSMNAEPKEYFSRDIYLSRSNWYYHFKNHNFQKFNEFREIYLNKNLSNVIENCNQIKNHMTEHLKHEDESLEIRMALRGNLEKKYISKSSVSNSCWYFQYRAGAFTDFYEFRETYLNKSLDQISQKNCGFNPCTNTHFNIELQNNRILEDQRLLVGERTLTHNSNHMQNMNVFNKKKKFKIVLPRESNMGAMKNDVNINACVVMPNGGQCFVNSSTLIKSAHICDNNESYTSIADCEYTQNSFSPSIVSIDDSSSNVVLRLSLRFLLLLLGTKLLIYLYAFCVENIVAICLVILLYIWIDIEDRY